MPTTLILMQVPMANKVSKEVSLGVARPCCRQGHAVVISMVLTDVARSPTTRLPLYSHLPAQQDCGDVSLELSFPAQSDASTAMTFHERGRSCKCIDSVEQAA